MSAESEYVDELEAGIAGFMRILCDLADVRDRDRHCRCRVCRLLDSVYNELGDPHEVLLHDAPPS